MKYYSELPDGRKVQRLDTLNLSHEEMIGIQVHHPHAQSGEDRCAWNKEQTIELDKAICGVSIYDDDSWFPEEHDIGYIVEVFTDKPFPDRTRARFVEDNGSDDYGLHYDLTNLWVVI